MNKKRGQVTIFVIIGIVVVVLGVLIYLFYPRISTTLGFGEESPSSFIQNCIEDEIKTNVDLLSNQGGSLSPSHYIIYNNEKIEYLCYTSEYYVTCVMQQPMLQEHIESEIQKGIKKESADCFAELEDSYKKKGYTVNLNSGNTTVELLPNRILTTFNKELTLTNGEAKTYDSFKVVVNNNLYELIGIANSILNWEARYGDAETTTYMNYYHDLQVQKKKQTDGSTIYIIKELNTGDKFQFASRSVAWPPGYGA
ncbi:MAG: hypothetical protein ABIB79_05255 [archaeon]